MKFGALRVTLGGQDYDLPLDVASLTVGSEPGSGLELSDGSVAARHARIVFDSGRLTVEDLGSANGTYLDGVRLQPGTVHVVGDGQALRFGGVDVRYAEPTGGLAPAEALVAGSQAALLRVDVAPIASPITPGTNAVTHVTVQNRSRIVDQVTLSTPDLPAGWATFQPATMSLLPDQSVEVPLVLAIPRAPGTPAGQLAFTVRADSRQGHSQSAASGLQVLPFDAFTVSMEPAASDRRFRIVAQNGGNTPQTFALSGVDDEAAFSYAFNPPSLVVPPGGDATVQVSVAAGGRPLSGAEQRRAFSIKATPTAGGVPQSFPGTLIVRPRFKRDPRKFVPAAIGLAAIIAAAALIPFCLSGGDDDDTVPATATQVQLQPGEEPTVHLCGDGTVPAGATPAATQTPIVVQRGDSADPAGPLFAQNDGRWGNVEYARAQDPEFGPDWCGDTIAECGCAMTSVATILSLFSVTTIPEGAPLSPETLNAWFNGDAKKTSRGWVSRGYVFGDVVWSAGGALSGQVAALFPGSPKVRFVRAGSGSDAEIRQELAAGRKVILEVPGHWIAVIGQEGNRILINDPYYPDRRYLDQAYPNKVKSSIMYESSDDLSALVVTVTSDQRIRVTDSNGKVVGTNAKGAPADAAKGAKRDIPEASYTFQEAWRDPNCIEKPPPPGAGVNQIIIPRPSGRYRIQTDDPNKKPVVVVHNVDKDGKINIDIKEDDDFGIEYPKVAVTVTPSVSPSATTTDTPTVSVTPTTPTTPTTVAVTSTSTNPSAPSVRVDCTAVPDGAAVAMTCQGSSTGATTTTRWAINGEGSATTGTTYQNRFTQSGNVLVAFTACNGSACTTATASIGINVPTPTPTPTVTPTPTNTATPTNTTVAGPTSASISCTARELPDRFEVTCKESVNGPYDNVVWTATNSTPASATTKPGIPFITYPAAGKGTIVAKACLGTAKCVETNVYTVTVQEFGVAIAIVDFNCSDGAACARIRVTPPNAAGTVTLYAASGSPTGGPPATGYSTVFSCSYPSGCSINSGLVFAFTNISGARWYYATFTPTGGSVWSSARSSTVYYDY
ncbi:MAG: FHA domain-containing protein [Dehalococcoidia bacterium]